MKYSNPVITVAAEIMSVSEETIKKEYKNNEMFSKALEVLENGLIKKSFGADVWEKAARGEAISQPNPIGHHKAVVLVGHKARMGKDTFVDFLKKDLAETGMRVRSLSYADAMKDIISEILGVSRETLDDMKNQSHYFRVMLQKFGSGKMKEFLGPDVWRNVMMSKIDKLDGDVFLIPDFRFPNEATGYLNSISVKVSRPGVKAINEHISETALNDYSFDLEIKNDGSLKNLQEKALNFKKTEIMEMIPSNRISKRRGYKKIETTKVLTPKLFSIQNNNGDSLFNFICTEKEDPMITKKEILEKNKKILPLARNTTYPLTQESVLELDNIYVKEIYDENGNVEDVSFGYGYTKNASPIYSSKEYDSAYIKTFLTEQGSNILIESVLTDEPTQESVKLTNKN